MHPRGPWPPAGHGGGPAPAWWRLPIAAWGCWRHACVLDRGGGHAHAHAHAHARAHAAAGIWYFGAHQDVALGLHPRDGAPRCRGAASWLAAGDGTAGLQGAWPPVHKRSCGCVRHPLVHPPQRSTRHTAPVGAWLPPTHAQDPPLVQPASQPAASALPPSVLPFFTTTTTTTTPPPAPTPVQPWLLQLPTNRPAPSPQACRTRCVPSPAPQAPVRCAAASCTAHAAPPRTGCALLLS